MMEDQIQIWITLETQIKKKKGKCQATERDIEHARLLEQ
jgi:hypothetical protein